MACCPPHSMVGSSSHSPYSFTEEAGKLLLLFHLLYIGCQGPLASIFLSLKQKIHSLVQINLARGVFLPKYCKCFSFYLNYSFLLHTLSFFFFLPSYFYILKHREEFKRHYRIPNNVSIVHRSLGEWHEKRNTKGIIIPMIAFIDGGMRIPMGRVTRDFLTLFRLCRTQCVPNMFRILQCRRVE